MQQTRRTPRIFLKRCLPEQQSWGIFKLRVRIHSGFPGSRVVKNPSVNAGNMGVKPGLGRSPGVGNGNPLRYSCLENSMDRGAWWATVHGLTELDMNEHTQAYIFMKNSYSESKL